jgi:DnaJ-class molecular chaperone
MECPDCHGKGSVIKEIEPLFPGMAKGNITVTCPTCSGKGEVPDPKERK